VVAVTSLPYGTQDTHYASVEARDAGFLRLAVWATVAVGRTAVTRTLVSDDGCRIFVGQRFVLLHSTWDAAYQERLDTLPDAVVARAARAWKATLPQEG
jgi:hypothetical protein